MDMVLKMEQESEPSGTVRYPNKYFDKRERKFY